MRMRKKKHGRERLEALSSYLLSGPFLEPGRTAEAFPVQDRPLMLEIGCGKGDFVLGMSARHPETNYVAMERVPDVLLAAVEKVAAVPVDSVRFLVGNAKNLLDYFAPATFDGIYLNFSDPWPKAGHVKRRLTYRDFLAPYRTVLKPGGFVALKTDNAALFSFSLESFSENGWRCEDITDDLHHSVWNRDNVVTEYERNFSEKGFSIHRVVAYPPEGNPPEERPDPDRAG